MVDRIKKIIDQKKLSPTQFADSIEVQRSSLSHVLSGRNKPSLDFLLKIKNRFPEINLDWLLLGEGSMNIQTEKKEISDPKNKDVMELNFTESGSNEIEDITRKTIPEKSENIPLPDNEKSGNRKLMKIIMLYDDNSFESFETRQ